MATYDEGYQEYRAKVDKNHNEIKVIFTYYFAYIIGLVLIFAFGFHGIFTLAPLALITFLFFKALFNSHKATEKRNA